MKPLLPAEIRGNWATLVLPIQSDDQIDYGLLEAEIDALIAADVDGIYSNGSAGEFYSQNETEFDRISQLLAERCERAQLPFQIGVSHTSAQIARERLRRARLLKPSGVQMILPDWFVPSWAELVDFVSVMVREAGSIPVILYNPPHAKRRLLPAEWIRLAEAVPQLAGMKVPGGDAQWYEQMQPVLRKLSVFIPGHTLATGISRGAHGAYSNVCCLSPIGAQRWADLCRTDLPAALELEAKIFGLFMNEVSPLITQDGLANMAADKAAAVAGGWLPGLHQRLRWPYRCASDERVAAIAAAARRILPEFLTRPL